MGIVKDIQVGSSSHFFILPEEELSVLYPEIKDFTGYVNLHVEQDSTNLWLGSRNLVYFSPSV